jgi:hypothetical protein
MSYTSTWRTGLAAFTVGYPVIAVTGGRGKAILGDAISETGADQNLAKSQIDVLKWSIWLVGRHRQFNLRPGSRRGQRFARHDFYRWPVLTEEVRCVVEIVRLHSNTAGLSAGSDPYLKVKIEADGFRVSLDRLIIQTHLVSPRFASFTLHSGFGFSLGAIMAR